MQGALRRYAARVEAAPQLSFVIPAFEVRHTAAPHRPEAAAAAVEEEEEHEVDDGWGRVMRF